MAHPDGVTCRTLWVICSKRWRPCGISCSKDCDFGLLLIFLLWGVRKVKIFSREWKILLTKSFSLHTKRVPKQKNVTKHSGSRTCDKDNLRNAVQCIWRVDHSHSRTYSEEVVKSLGWKVVSKFVPKKNESWKNDPRKISIKAPCRHPVFGPPFTTEPLFQPQISGTHKVMKLY
jgi:hypothetical protein